MISIRIISLTLLLITPCFASAQTLSPSAANDLLPALRNDDSVLFKTVIAKHHPDGTVLLNLAVATNCPRIFPYVLEHFPEADPELSVLLALRTANQAILEAALDKKLSLGEYPVNQLLASAWTTDEDEITPIEPILQLLIGTCLPETSFNDYIPLLVNAPSDAVRASVAQWLIGRQQAFDYLDFPRLVQLKAEYQPAIQLLVKRLLELPPGQAIRGFAERRQALIFAAVLNNDLPMLRELAEDAETLEFNVGNRSLFSYAVALAGLPVIRYLLARGANADWYLTDPYASILGAVLQRGDEAILQAVMPYIRNTAIKNEDGNTPVYFCVQSFFNLPATEKYVSQRQFYVAALKALRHSGADFNQANGRYDLPVHLLPGQLNDSLARSVVILVLEQTSDQPGLDTYAGNFIYSTPADSRVLTVLCQQLQDPGSLFYNSDLQKAGLFPVILKEAKHLPGLRVYSALLRSASYYKNVQQVRWLLNDVPMAYVNRNPSLDPDSLRSAIVNTPFAGEGENVLYYFLSHEHTADWSGKSVMKALMAAGSDLYQVQTYDRKRPIDLLLASEYYQKHYANEILSGLLTKVKLQCDAPGSWEKASTGDLYRRSILSYQKDRSWLQDLKQCVTMDLNGSAVSAAPNRRVNITGPGFVALGKFPVESCAPIAIDKIAGTPPRYVFDFSASVETGPYPLFSTADRKEVSSLRASVRVNGHSGLEKMTLSVKSTINIPGSILDTGNHAIPPMIIIRNNGDQVIIHQQDVPDYLGKDAEKICDRSKGPIKIEYQRNHDKSDLQLEIFGQVQDTPFPDLVVPKNNDVVSRLRLYAEIVRLQDKVRSNPGKTAADHIYNKQDGVLIHLLSEYALQRGFPQKVKDEYDQNIVQMADLNKLLEQLGLFYQQHTVLDYTDVASLRNTLEALIKGPALSDRQRGDYTALLQRLNQATELSQLADTYSQLMNTELLQQAERQLDDKNRIGLETTLYTTSGHLKLEDKP